MSEQLAKLGLLKAQAHGWQFVFELEMENLKAVIDEQEASGLESEQEAALLRKYPHFPLRPFSLGFSDL